MTLKEAVLKSLEDINNITNYLAVLNHIVPLSEVRGKWKNIKIKNSYFDILTTFHPAFLLRKPAKIKIMLKDFLKIKKI